MSKETELLPCPFCGGDVEEKHRHNFNAVACTTCHATVPQSGIGYGDAGKLWNRRAADRELRRGDAGMPVIAYLRATASGEPIWTDDCVCQDAVFPSDPDGSDENDVSMPMVRQSDAQAALAEAQAVAERMKLEAQIHAQEARTANATIAEIYQLCTGATGEPGNWHGAEPVRAALAVKDAEIERLTKQNSAYASLTKNIDALTAELTAKQIEAGWKATFSTNNPFCPCDLRSFTKAVQWAERHRAAIAKEKAK